MYTLNAGGEAAGLTGEGGLLGGNVSGSDAFGLGQGLLGGGQSQDTTAQRGWLVSMYSGMLYLISN